MANSVDSDQMPHKKTHLYNVYPLKPHFYIVKLGFTGVYIIFLISAHQGSSNDTMSRNVKNIRIIIRKHSVFDDEIFNIFE